MNGPDTFSSAEPSGAVPRAGCSICGRPTFDPGRGEPPWVRGVSGGGQVLVCPDCQASVANWSERLDRCQRCGGTRLSAMLGEVVCRACGEVQRLVRSDAEADAAGAVEAAEAGA